MIIFYGTRMYGKVDKTPSGAHIATNFFYLQFIPLIPLGSTLVLRQKGGNTQGLKVPLNFKSILVAYARTAGVVGLIAAIIGGFVAAGGEWGALLVALVGLAAFGLLTIGTYYIPGIGVATPARAQSIDAHIMGVIQQAVEEEQAEQAAKAENAAKPARLAGAAGVMPAIAVGGGDAPAAPERPELKPQPVAAAPAESTDSFLVECPTCQKQLRAKHSMVGQTTKCPACQNLMEVGDPAEG